MVKAGAIGVVTVTFNSASVIVDFMESMLKQEGANFILYIIDNASSDDTCQRLSEYHDTRIVLIRNDRNVGVAEGNNIGIRAALRDACAFVLFINNDTVFDSNLLSELSKGQRQYNCDMVVPKILFFDDPTKIWCAGAYFSRLRGSARHFGYGQKDVGQFDRPRQVSYGPTCCLMVKAEVFDRIGLMDHNYFVYFDDTDFCYRAYRSGLSLFYIPSGRIFHKVSSLTGTESEFSIRHNIRNHVYYMLKNFPKWQSWFYLPIFQLYIIAKFLVSWRSMTAFNVAERAFWEGFSHFSARAEISTQSPRTRRHGYQELDT
jgi:GT2 family glycosyltransferase